MMDNEIPASVSSELIEKVSAKVQTMIYDAGGLLYSSATGKNMSQADGNLYKKSAGSGTHEAELLKIAGNYMISPKDGSGLLANLHNHQEQIA